MKNILAGVLVLVLSGSVFAEPCTHDYKKIVAAVQQMGFVVTSTTGGRHNKGSKHYIGRAVDVSVRNQTDLSIEMLMQTMTDIGYVVLDERKRPKGQRVWGGPHIHIHAPFCEVKEDRFNVFDTFR